LGKHKNKIKKGQLKLAFCNAEQSGFLTAAGCAQACQA
jgi:hypothetical protein